MTTSRTRPPRPAGPARLQATSEIVVVVPVHDEQELLGACLRSIRRATGHVALRGIRTRIVVVLDHCRDASDEVALAHLTRRDAIVEVSVRNVGAARAAGVAHALDAVRTGPERVWLAHTDADSEVPIHWLARQLVAARRADAVAGVVRVGDWSPRGDRVRKAFDRSYGTRPFGVHPHVHGANLGVRASAYLDVGGFPSVACSEDHALWGALRGAGHRVRSTRRVWVSTSARREGRAVGGFADTLSAL